MVNNSIQQIPEKKIFYDSGQSWLNANRIYLNENLYINIPTVREILDHLSLKFRGSKNQSVIDMKQSLAQNKVVLYCD